MFNKIFFLTKVYSTLSSGSATEIFEEKSGRWVEELEFIMPDNNGPIPSYRVMDLLGRILRKSQEPQVLLYFLFKMLLFLLFN